MKPTCVELFAGGGGAALGLEKAGYRHLLAFDNQPHCVQTLLGAGFDAEAVDLSLPEAPATVVQLLQERSAKGIDLLWASPPCQAWSQAGRRLGREDARNGWPWTFAILDALARTGLKPRAVACENVAGMVNHTKAYCELQGNLFRPTPGEPKCAGCYWDTVVVSGFRERYRFVEWHKLNAADYGLPQTRNRVYLMASEEPFGFDPSQGRTRGVSLGAALGLTGTVNGNPVIDDRWLHRPSPAVLATEYKGARHMFNLNKHRTPMRASDAYFRAAAIFTNELERGWDGHRRLSVEQCMILQGFPPTHRFAGNKQQRYEQVGNAVPPPMAALVGTAFLGG